MAARTGLFVAPVPGSPPVGTSPTDGRIVLGALFGTIPGCVSGGGLTSSASTMSLSIALATWRIPDPTNTAAVYLSPADAATLTFSAGPASGSRIDVAWVRQNNYEAGDADSRVTYGVAAGTAGSSPATPAIPAGAMKVATVTVPTGVSNLAACTVVAAYPQTTVPADIAVPSSAQLPAAGAFYAQRALVGAVEWRWNGTAWKPWNSDWTGAGIDVGGVNGGYNATPGWSYTSAQYRYVDGLVRFRGNFFLNGSTSAPTQLNVALPVNASVATGAHATGRAVAVNDSDTSAKYALDFALDSGGFRLYFMVGGGAKAAGAFGTAPFGESWAQSDSVTWDVTYDPA